jgi:hypothetical protein
VSARLRRGASPLCALRAALALALGACAVTPSPEPTVAGRVEPWPLAAEASLDAVDVATALASSDGAPLRVRATLLAVSAPCPACAVGERTGPRPEPPVGSSLRPHTRAMPGCLPCPSPSPTFGDGAASPTLRAVGVAEGLQRRHVGREFLLVGTLRARARRDEGSDAPPPVLDVVEVRAIEAR